MTIPRLPLALTVVLAPVILAGQPASRSQATGSLARDAPFTVAVNTSTIEAAPVYLASAEPLGARFDVITGGVRNLANGGAHAATNAETQMLIAATPDVRLLLTVAEGLYRVVGRRSSGIASMADLRGKRIATPRDTSAHYFLVRNLASAGIAESEVTIVDLPRDGMAAGLFGGQADAISMWEPESQKAVDELGADAIVLESGTTYRELFSLYATTGVLNDPRRRRELVAFVGGLLVRTEEMKAEPTRYFPLVAKVIGRPEALVARAFPHHAFPMDIPADLLDVMVEEDQWVARNQGRAPRMRDALASLIDASVLNEARALVAGR